MSCLELQFSAIAARLLVLIDYERPLKVETPSRSPGVFFMRLHEFRPNAQ